MERHDLIHLFQPPLGKRFASERNENRERARSETSSDRETSDLIGDVNDTVPDFDSRRTLQQDRRVEVLASHSVNPAHNSTRQRDSGTETAILIHSKDSELPKIISPRLPRIGRCTPRGRKDSARLPDERVCSVRAGFLHASGC